MLQIEPKDRERFADAYARLVLSIEDPAWQGRIVMAVAIANSLRNAGAEPPRTLDTTLAEVLIRIVLQHMYQGFPLALPMVVLNAYVAAGEGLITPLFECSACGYCLPRSFATCPLCGGQVGLWAFGRRRSRSAACN
jgi:hypothetical protein